MAENKTLKPFVAVFYKEQYLSPMMAEEPGERWATAAKQRRVLW